jgi:hypothetical protein
LALTASPHMHSRWRSTNCPRTDGRRHGRMGSSGGRLSYRHPGLQVQGVEQLPAGSDNDTGTLGAKVRGTPCGVATNDSGAARWIKALPT